MSVMSPLVASIEPPDVAPGANLQSPVDPSLLPHTLRGRLVRRSTSSCLSSTVVHLGLLLCLALFFPVVQEHKNVAVLTAGLVGEDELQLTDVAIDAAVAEAAAPHLATPDPATKLAVPEMVSISPATQPREEPSREFGVEAAFADALLLSAGPVLSNALSGRDPKARAELAVLRGGSATSEAAVERGLRWLVAHQMPDGSWRFKHDQGNCEGQCRNPGAATTSTGATALALLPFLGAGYTHQRGEFKEVVERGLKYLLRRMRTTPHGGDLQEGTMYAQGLATIALCEAYGMTRDPALREPAQLAVDFIVYAQDKQGGGWRYTPGQTGDTTVTGWQLMALKSAQMAYLNVPPTALEAASRFLDSVQAEYGTYYGYQDPGKGPTTTSIGLLCRMYGGWSPDHPGLQRGVSFLARQGPHKDDVYFNYYATQVLLHYGGPQWDQWNTKLRDKLVAAQADRGHESGSWYFHGRNSEQGGRLFCTALAIMTLEVYYRYQPLYRAEVLDAF